MKRCVCERYFNVHTNFHLKTVKCLFTIKDTFYSLFWIHTYIQILTLTMCTCVCSGNVSLILLHFTVCNLSNSDIYCSQQSFFLSCAAAHSDSGENLYFSSCDFRASLLEPTGKERLCVLEGIQYIL